MVDTVYIAASARDSRFTRTCVASIRRFYPTIRVRLLPGSPLSRRLLLELRRYWDVEMSTVRAENYGWGFVKLEPLFGPADERFLVLDSDTVITGPLLDIHYAGGAAFVVDDEAQSEADTRRLYYDWDRLRAVDPAACQPRFVFNSGQWFGTAGVLSRHDFSPWIDWSLPRKLRHPDLFMPGDQGVLNYVLNQKAARGDLIVERRKLMRWPGHGMDGLDSSVVANQSCTPLVVHWAGLKRARQRDMTGADVLAHFERYYYRHLPAGRVRRLLASCGHVLAYGMHEARVRLGLLRRRVAFTAAPSGGTV